ncbi:MAG: OmpA family protein [Gemmatimonadaceae bacterium]|nr:OmpA family protein [Gemmatimonadaceae bacterium]
MLSRTAFRELKERGETPFRQLHLQASVWQDGAEAPDPDATVYIDEDVSGTLRRIRMDRLRLQLNDSAVQVPVIQAEVLLRDASGSRPVQRQRLVILDDERVPLVLDNERSSTKSRIWFTRISWPQRKTLERKLEAGEEVTVYGIYFDYNSAAIRTESDSVLAEIGGVLAAHPEWQLSIEGHTDSVGGRAFNETLSLQRAEAVADALVERSGVARSRLTARGAGASRPVETNATPEGRAFNRRVELRRQ